MKSVEVAQPIGNKSVYFASIILTGNGTAAFVIQSQYASSSARSTHWLSYILSLRFSVVSTIRTFAFRHFSASCSEAV